MWNWIWRTKFIAVKIWVPTALYKVKEINEAGTEIETQIETETEIKTETETETEI